MGFAQRHDVRPAAHGRLCVPAVDRRGQGGDATGLAPCDTHRRRHLSRRSPGRGRRARVPGPRDRQPSPIGARGGERPPPERQAAHREHTIMPGTSAAGDLRRSTRGAAGRRATHTASDSGRRKCPGARAAEARAHARTFPRAAARVSCAKFLLPTGTRSAEQQRAPQCFCARHWRVHARRSSNHSWYFQVFPTTLLGPPAVAQGMKHLILPEVIFCTKEKSYP